MQTTGSLRPIYQQYHHDYGRFDERHSLAHQEASLETETGDGIQLLHNDPHLPHHHNHHNLHQQQQQLAQPRYIQLSSGGFESEHRNHTTGYEENLTLETPTGPAAPVGEQLLVYGLNHPDIEDYNQQQQHLLNDGQLTTINKDEIYRLNDRFAVEYQHPNEGPTIYYEPLTYAPGANDLSARPSSDELVIRQQAIYCEQSNDLTTEPNITGLATGHHLQHSSHQAYFQHYNQQVLAIDNHHSSLATETNYLGENCVQLEAEQHQQQQVYQNLDSALEKQQTESLTATADQQHPSPGPELIAGEEKSMPDYNRYADQFANQVIHQSQVTNNNNNDIDDQHCVPLASLFTAGREDLHSPGASSISDSSSEESSNSTLTRDEKRAREANLPISYHEIVNLSIEQFNEQLARQSLTDLQLQLIKDIRRRGKNKVAAQSCRKRKMEQIYELQHEVGDLANKRISLEHECDQLVREYEKLVQDYNRIQSIVQQRLQQHTQPFSCADQNHLQNTC